MGDDVLVWSSYLVSVQYCEFGKIMNVGTEPSLSLILGSRIFKIRSRRKIDQESPREGQILFGRWDRNAIHTK